MLDTRKKAPETYWPDRFNVQVGGRPRRSFGLGSLRSRKGLLGVGTILFLALGLLYVVRRAPTYTASGQVLIYVKQMLPGADLTTLPGRADLSLVRNQIEMLRSGNVLTKVVQTLQLNQDSEFGSGALDAVRRKLSARQIGTSHLISVNFKASDPEKAARIVHGVLSIYLQELVRASEAASSKAPALRDLYQNLGPSAHVISEPEPPLGADGPPAALILLAAALSGFGVAAAIAVLLDAINDTIRSAQQMECALGLACLGVIPSQPIATAAADGVISQRLPASQAMQNIAVAVLDASSRGVKTIGVTSTLPGEGATTLAIALAYTLTGMDRKVLLIDRVCENPTVSYWALKLPHISSETSVRARFSISENLVKAQDGLHIIPVLQPGRCGVDRTLAEQRTEIPNGVMDSYDFIIVDMPSLAASPDVRAAARTLDGFILVVKWGETESELIRQGLQSAGEAREKFFGAVLNMADEKMMRLYGSEDQTKLRFATSS